MDKNTANCTVEVVSNGYILRGDNVGTKVFVDKQSLFNEFSLAFINGIVLTNESIGTTIKFSLTKEIVEKVSDK